ncbi:MAG: ferrochelatase [Burkholderiaceae bacterium]|jgi:ferrochelatase|nr:ferrochelatase [Burkholderiaceae bacterium]
MNSTPRFAAEPAYSHGQPAKTAIVYCNLGTPQAPTAPALRRYLAEFLSDPRVVEIPRFLWLMILHGIILRVRPAKSAHKYASIWTTEGSPLKVWTEKQSLALQQLFDPHKVVVRYAMRYGSPAVPQVLDELKAQGVTRVLVLPAYPQYSGTTTASVFDAVYAWGMRTRNLPELRFINHYHDHPGYIEALAEKIRAHWAQHGRAEQLVMSFHGVPERTLLLGDPYHCECHKTARLLAQSLGLSKDEYKVCFQSRFGKAKWLEPYTEPTVRELARQGCRSVQIVCPGFVSDCLETLEEIALEVKAAFLEEGGEQFHYIECINDSPVWIQAMHSLTMTHMSGWPLEPASDADRSVSRQAALAIGAKN